MLLFSILNIISFMFDNFLFAESRLTTIPISKIGIALTFCDPFQ